MSTSLCYATNVHPAEDLAGILEMLDGPAAAVRERFDAGAVLGLGLWLPRAAAGAIAGSAAAAAEVRARLRDRGLRIATVNAFPVGGFHAARVKEGAYAPDWSDPARLDYTISVGRAIARIVEPGTECVASTLPGTWKGWSRGPAPVRALAEGLAAAAGSLASIAEATGVRVVLAPEPEPDRLRPHLGLCADLAHLAVAGEDPAAAIAQLRRGGVPIAKVQASAALEIALPAVDAEAVAALRAFDEPRWLHQASGRDGVGVWRRAADLPEVFANLDAWRRLAPWRVHFHAPLHREEVAGVRTTHALVAPALRVAASTDGAPPVIEVETYTWSAVPGFTGAPADLAESIAAELRFARDAISTIDSTAAAK
jgi:sugar phosphate isomerase/epimerase